jgi:hypothetical protein
MWKSIRGRWAEARGRLRRTRAWGGVAAAWRWVEHKEVRCGCCDRVAPADVLEALAPGVDLWVQVRDGSAAQRTRWRWLSLFQAATALLLVLLDVVAVGAVSFAFPGRGQFLELVAFGVWIWLDMLLRAVQVATHAFGFYAAVGGWVGYMFVYWEGVLVHGLVDAAVALALGPFLVLVTAEAEADLTSEVVALGSAHILLSLFRFLVDALLAYHVRVSYREMSADVRAAAGVVGSSRTDLVNAADAIVAPSTDMHPYAHL